MEASPKFVCFSLIFLFSFFFCFLFQLGAGGGGVSSKTKEFAPVGMNISIQE